MKHLNILWIFLKVRLHLPIYGIDVLNWTEYYLIGETSGLCEAIDLSLKSLGLKNSPTRYCIVQYFPKYTRQNAQMFRYKNYTSGAYWWHAWDWDKNGRLGFFYWLKDQYKNDKTNLRKLNVK